MDGRDWGRVTAGDQRWFRGYGLVAVQMALNLVLATHAAGTEGMPGPLSVCLGALAVLFPLLARSLGQSFLAAELWGDPVLASMVGWRILCWATGFAPVAVALLWAP